MLDIDFHNCLTLARKVSDRSDLIMNLHSLCKGLLNLSCTHVESVLLKYVAIFGSKVPILWNVYISCN